MQLFTKRYHSPGTRPGTLAPPESGGFKMDLVDYNESTLSEKNDIDVTECRPFLDNSNVTWIHVQGNPTHDALRSLAKGLDIHDLYVEDVANTGQRPKAEISEEQVFLILSLAIKDEESVNIEQVSLFLIQNTVISFCSGNYDPFEPVIQRLRAGKGKVRKLQADYLLYCLADAVVDYGFPLMESYAEQIEILEDKLLHFNNTKMLNSVHKLRRELLLLRRKLWPQKEVFSELLRAEDNAKLSSVTKMHFTDCHDHIVSIMELLETYYEMTSGLMELYMIRVNLKMNDVIKVLTIISTVFIPATFIVGVYGMNFDTTASPFNMPELNWRYGYLMIWGVIALSFTGILIFFRKHKWI